MLKTTLTLAALSLALLLATSVSAQNIQYKGPHSTAAADFVDGGRGVLIYNDLCSAAFDGAQMCESIDVLRSGSPVPVGSGAGAQWIKPSLVTAFFDGVDVVFVDASGASSSAVGGLSCDGWISVSATDRGLAMDPLGRWLPTRCDLDLPVACCKVSSGKK